MFRKLLLPLLALTLGSCGVPLVNPPLKDARPGLWVVRGGDTTIYICGTLPILGRGVRWYRGALRNAFEASDELVLEFQPPGDEMARIRKEVATTPQNIDARISPQTLAKLRVALVKYGMRAHTADNHDPWYVANAMVQVAMTYPEIAWQGFRLTLAPQPILVNQASKLRKRITGIDSYRDRLLYYDQLSAGAQAILLDRTLDNLPNLRPRLRATTDAWAAGDVDRAATLMNQEFADSPEAREKLLAAPNRRWADWVVARMARPGKVFVLVGADHLGGADTLQAELARRGLKVARIEE